MTLEPAKLLIERRHAPGQGEAFERWTRRVLECARASGALLGSSVLTIGDEEIILLRFDDRNALSTWESAPQTRRLLTEWPYALDASTASMVRTGFETWFSLPATSASPPAKWKMALVTWCALFPHSLLLGQLIPKDLPYPLGPALTTSIPLISLTWLVMPRLSVWLRGFLYGSTESASRPITRLSAPSA